MSRSDNHNPDVMRAGAAASDASMAARLRALLASPSTEFLMEAHNGLSARIVEEAGFRGIWASGLAISAQYGVRDCNEASWTQVLHMAEFMSDATCIPILLDGDTGFGSFNNVRRLVQKLEQRGIAGVCIEDKLFPKTNSFLSGGQEPLADLDEFCGKIRAATDSRRDPDFCVVARVEALIAGQGMREALRRAEAYHDAGADAIFIHSRQRTADEILAFSRAWGGRAPLVIAPTTYHASGADAFREAGLSIVLWANHMIRAAVLAMQSVARTVRHAESIEDMADRLAPLDEVFRLQRADELREAERRYVPAGRTPGRAIVLAPLPENASVTARRPTSCLATLAENLRHADVREIIAVTPEPRDDLAWLGVTPVIAPAPTGLGDVARVEQARAWLGEDSILAAGDLRVRSYILRELAECEAPIVTVVDSDPTGTIRGGGSHAYAWCSAPDDRSPDRTDVTLQHVAAARPVDRGEPSGRWIGLLAVRGDGRVRLQAALDELGGQADFDRLNLPDLLNHLVGTGTPVQVLYIHGHWRDVDDPASGGHRLGPGAGRGTRKEDHDQRGDVRRTGTSARA